MRDAILGKCQGLMQLAAHLGGGRARSADVYAARAAVALKVERCRRVLRRRYGVEVSLRACG